MYKAAGLIIKFNPNNRDVLAHAEKLFPMLLNHLKEEVSKTTRAILKKIFNFPFKIQTKVF